MAASYVTSLPSTEGVECVAAYFDEQAFAPHAHDTYAIGVTVSGVQSFNYRGASRHSLPGEIFVLHPCERHDGRPGDDRGYGYRIAYVDPALVREVAGSGALPHVADPVSQDLVLYHAVRDLLRTTTHDRCELALADVMTRLVDSLLRVGEWRPTQSVGIDERAVRRARSLLSDTADGQVSLRDLEGATGLSRWQLTRQFRTAFGVSPYRFQVFRRLDRVRTQISRGTSLADAAAMTGFADQAHMSRHFKRAFGISPGQWQQLASANRHAS